MRSQINHTHSRTAASLIAPAGHPGACGPVATGSLSALDRVRLSGGIAVGENFEHK